MKLARPTSRLFSSSSATQPAEQFPKNKSSISAIRELHGHLIRTQLHTDPTLMEDVIRSYTLSPALLPKARLAFDQIERPTLLVWNHIIRGLSQGNQPIEAIHRYICLHRKGVVFNNLTFTFAIKACARILNVVHGLQLHCHALKFGFEHFLFVSNALIHMYASCGHVVLARGMFDKMLVRDLVSWNSMICGYCQNNKFVEVLSLFDAMQVSKVKADAVTMMKVVLACNHLGNWGYTGSVVKYIEVNNIEIDVYLGNTLIDMYGRRGLVELAQGVFNRMWERNIVSWNTMIMALAKAGNLVDARQFFNDMPERDVISWTSMITGYSQCNQFSEAVKLFQEMTSSKVKADEITVASVLSACAHLGMLDVGVEVHDYIRKHELKADIYVGNALIDMYCKCGAVEQALEVFQGMKSKDAVSWTSVISGVAVNGFASSAVDLFSQMLSKGVHPTHGTFVGILLACTHAGLVDEGLRYFGSMEKVHGLVPQMKHYGCVVDLLSRCNRLGKAYEFIKKMPISPDVVLWRILLSSCKVHGDVALAEIATKEILELDPFNSGNYVLLSNAYAGADRWDEAIKVREMMEVDAVPKPSGCSSIEVNGVMANNSRKTLHLHAEFHS